MLLKIRTLSKQASLGKHEFKVALKDNLIFCVRQDIKAAMVLSNYHDPTEKGSVKRRKQEYKQTKVVVPACLSDYQKHMKGVDVLEQMVGYYQFKHHSKKWWTRLFFLLAVGCYNAYIAARCAGGKTFTAECKSGSKEWLEDLAQELVSLVTARSAPQPTVPEGATFAHDCEKLSQKRRICRQSALSRSGTNARVTATVYGCRQCTEAVHIKCFGKHIC